MIKYIVSLSVVVLFSSCLKNTQNCGQSGSTIAPDVEKQRVTSYLSANPDASAVQLENSGLYYTVITQGSSKKPSLCSAVRVMYIGRRENGTVFDETLGTATRSFTLGGLIEGWRRALPLIGEGGKIRTYIPPSLAYGPQGSVDSRTGEVIIPPNEIIIFDIELVSVR